jgi:hypothetical protein
VRVHLKLDAVCWQILLPILPSPICQFLDIEREDGPGLW